ncbi:heterokaryon incompatibility protein-domain-containing protein [Cadophora sp. MPI-SDFR-AT-0126]|nr:heterokaryon incompatibility protein-domain-containing protein [Leotiomycetes sp. MPI-SDFR-AT-0126]
MSTTSSATIHGFPNFTYEPLDLSASRPSIRLAILQPGPRNASIRVKLGRAAFAERPKYEALSYTWGRADDLRAIELNGTRVEVRKNLALALVHLRHTSEERVLWIDAICINQADLEERNRQVELMAYIYARAKRVLVWLGIIPHSPLYQSQMGSGTASDLETLDALCRQSYWRRIWIVQEIGAAADLELHWGLNSSMDQESNWQSKSGLWTDFFGTMVDDETTNLAVKLARQREGRHGDSFLLANLMEVCKDSLCEEPRDKVYGFVGIAHDCQDGSFPVDYSKSLFEVYEDVIRFQYRSTALNTKTVVHFSQLVQKLLGGVHQMQRDLGDRKSPLVALQTNNDRTKAFRAVGVYTGSVSSVGCSYDEFIAVPDATRKWKVSLQKCQTDLEKLRRKNEGFMRVLLDLEKPELDRIRAIEPNFSWKGAKDMHGVLGVPTKGTRSEHELLPLFKFGPEENGETEPSAPRLFSTRSGVIGLIPSNARVGDMLFHFWESDVVAVVRLEVSYVRIIGRAAIANADFTPESKFYTPSDWDQFADNGKGKGLEFEKKGIELYVDIPTLQLLTQ